METRFREQVRRERERRKWSQADLAKRLQAKGCKHIIPSTVAKIEAGDRAVRIDEADALADLLGTSVDVLLGRNRDAGRTGFVWAAAQLQALVRRSVNDFESVSERIADELSAVRYHAEQATGSGDELIRATEIALSALSETQQALTALARVPIPAAVTITRIKRSAQ